MEQILWEKYSPTEFQAFCNALLSFEISKNYIPFNAEGKDTGYDGKYIGEYEGKSGLWRFQCKFHKTSRRESFGAIKNRDIKTEINKVKEENNLILLTNTLLLPQEREEIITTASELLIEKGKIVYFDIWDGAKLSNLSLRFPLIRLWLDDKFTSQLQEYNKEKFKLFEDEPYFTGRDEQIKQLHTFLQSQNTLALITGEAGIGKTRLCIEFFETLKSHEDWRILILSAHTVDYDKINIALSGDNDFIVFIDDAHNYSPEIIADIYAIVATKKTNKVKLVITARSIFYEYLKLIKEFKQQSIEQIVLGKLEPEETKTILQKELNESYLGNYIIELADISRGRPILISAIINSTKNGIQIAEIKKQSFIKDYVTTYFEAFIDIVATKTSEQKIKLRNLLLTICLIEPIQYKNKDVIQMLSEKEQISVDTTELFFENLIKYGYASGKYDLSIKPDFYSDIYLSTTALESWLQRSMEKYYNYTSNIIQNLVAIDEDSSNEKRGLIDQILQYYIDKIETISSISELDDIFTTLDYVSYSKPRFADQAVQKLISLAENKEHWLNHILIASLKKDVNTPYRYKRSVKSILFNLSYHEDFFPAVSNKIVKLFIISGDNSLFTRVVGFSRREAINNYQLDFQLYFVNYIQTFLNEGNEGLVNFILNGFKELLRLTFTTSTTDFTDKYKIHITTYYIREYKTVIDLRLKIIESTIDFYNNAKRIENRHLAFDLIVDIPREIMSARRDKKLYEGKAEIARIIKFLLQITKNNIDISFHQKIHEKLYWYSKWSITKYANEDIKKIEENLDPQTLSEKLLKLFTRTSEDIDLDFKKLEERFNVKAKKLIEKYSEEEIFKTLVEIGNSYKQKLPQYYSNFIQLILDKPQKAIIIFELAYSNDHPFIMQWGCVFLRVLRFKYGLNDFFWKYVNEIYSLNTFEAYNCLLYIYHYLTNDEDKKQLIEKDVELIKAIYQKNHKENYHYLSYSLTSILSVNTTIAKELLGEYFEKCDQNSADNLLFHLLNYYSEYFDVIKDLLYNHSLKHDISYYFERGLQLILDTEFDTAGYDNLIKYLHKRYEYLIEIREDDSRYIHYDFVPRGDRQTLLENRTPEERIDIFLRAIEWYLTISGDYYEKYLAKDLLEYLQPANYLTTELKTIYQKLIERNSDSSEKLLNIVSTLDIFHDKNEELVEVVIQILNVNESKYANTEIYKEIKYRCYEALTTLGGKSGTAGQPFQVDLNLQKFLKEQLLLHRDNPLIIDLLNRALKNVERDINDERFRDENEW